MPLMSFPSAMQLMYSRLPFDMVLQLPSVHPLPKPPEAPRETSPTKRMYS